MTFYSKICTSEIICVSSDSKSDQFTGTTRRTIKEQWFLLENSDGSIELINCYTKRHLTCDNYSDVGASTNTIDGERWNICKLSNSPNDVTYVLSNVASGRYLHYDRKTGEIGTLRIVNSQRIHFEILSGELLFLSSPWAKKQLSLNISSYSILRGNAEPTLSSTWDTSEVWRFIEAGKGQIYIMRWQDQTILTSDDNGDLSTTTFYSSLGEDDKGSKWMVQLSPENSPDGVTLKSVLHGRYLQVGPNGKVRTYESNQGEPPIWHFEVANRKQFFLSSKVNDKRLTGPDANHEFKGSSNLGTSEVWQMEHYQAGHHHYMSLQSINRKKYLNSDVNGNLYESNTCGENGLWELCTVPHDNCNISLKSKASGRYLSYQLNENVCTRVISKPGQDEAWLLQPVLPGSIVSHRNKYLTMLGGSAIGMALGPLAVMGTVGAIGFGTGGIGAGTFAAWMMSLEGVTAAGGVVATLQSVGAVGLGATGMAASMSAGAIVGGSTSAVARGVSGDNYRDGDGMVHVSDVKKETNHNAVKCISNKSHHHPRPFCDWKSW